MDTKKENFKRIAENRTNKILVTLQQLQNLTNTSFYEYEKEDVLRMISALEKELKKTKKVLLEAKDKKKMFEL